jgi:hypothetical protein
MPALPALHLGSPVQLGPLTVFPIWTDAPLAPRRYRTTLPAAGAVSEHDGGPSVESLTVTNPGATPVLLLEGALLEGGWQHRVLAGSVLIGARNHQDVDVRCVEQNRWGGERGHHFGTHRAPLAVRGALRGLRADAPRADREYDRRADQSDVWRRVNWYEQSHGVSPTSSLVDIHRNTEPSFAELLQGIRPLPAQRGLLIGVAGHPVLLEVFDHPDTLAEHWDAILSSLALDATIIPAAETPGHRARTFVRLARATRLSEEGQAGAGVAVGGTDQHLVSVRGIWSERLLHAAVVNVRHQLVLAA